MFEKDTSSNTAMIELNENSPVTKYPICLVPPEQHYDSPWSLIEDFARYERERSPLYNEHPELIPSDEKFEQVKTHNGYKLIPTSRDNCVLYRGQGVYANPCLPTIFRRNRSEIEIFADRVRAAEFELMLKRFDIIKRFEAAHFEVDYIGLAQHYGINTDVLDLTIDIRIALFFAMCRLNKATDNYEPQNQEDEYVGYIYAVLPLTNHSKKGIKNSLKYVFDDKIKAIGLQPFKRPGRQRGFSLHYTDKKSDISGYLYSFSYTKEDSEKIWNIFCHEQPDFIWCHDDIADYAKQIVSTNVFTYPAVSLAAKRWANGISAKRMSEELKESGFKIVSIKKTPWNDANVKCTDEQWAEILSHIVRYRYTQGGIEHEFRDTQIIGTTMMMSLLSSGLDAPIDYDSGCKFLQYKDVQVFALEHKVQRSPMCPDDDRKINPTWKQQCATSPTTRSFSLPDQLKLKWTKVQKR